MSREIDLSVALDGQQVCVSVRIFPPTPDRLLLFLVLVFTATTEAVAFVFKVAAAAATAAAAAAAAAAAVVVVVASFIRGSTNRSLCPVHPKQGVHSTPQVVEASEVPCHRRLFCDGT